MRINLSSILKESQNEQDITLVLKMEKGSPKEILIRNFRNMCVVVHKDNAHIIQDVNSYRQLDDKFDKALRAFQIYPVDIVTVYVSIPALKLEYSFGEEPKTVIFYPHKDTKARVGTETAQYYVEINGNKWDKEDCTKAEYFTCLADVDRRINCTGDLVLRHQNNLLFVENRDKNWYNKDVVAIFSGDLTNLSRFLMNFGFGDWWYIEDHMISNRIYKVEHNGVSLLKKFEGVSLEQNPIEKNETKNFECNVDETATKENFKKTLEDKYKVPELTVPIDDDLKNLINRIEKENMAILYKKSDTNKECDMKTLTREQSYNLRRLCDTFSRLNNVSGLPTLFTSKETAQEDCDGFMKINKGTNWKFVGTPINYPTLTQYWEQERKKNKALAFPEVENRVFPSTNHSIIKETNIGAGKPNKTLTDRLIDLGNLLNVKEKELAKAEQRLKESEISAVTNEDYREIAFRKATVENLNRQAKGIREELKKLEQEIIWFGEK